MRRKRKREKREREVVRREGDEEGKEAEGGLEVREGSWRAEPLRERWEWKREKEGG